MGVYTDALLAEPLDLDDVDPDVVEVAAFLLWSASGRQVGRQQVTVLPSIPPPPVPTNIPAAATGSGYGAGWNWRTWGGCAAPQLRLPGGPVSVQTVVVDGAALDPSAFTLLGDRLTRLDGLGWPVGQMASRRFSVTYTRGQYLDDAGRVALTEFARQMATAARERADGGNCTVPQQVTTITRQGITMDTVDVAALVDGGRTGITVVDRWLEAVNPFGVQVPPALWSPDVAQFLEVVDDSTGDQVTPGG